MPRRITTTIDLSGPFFTKDPAKTFRQNVRVMLEAMATEGAEDVKAQLAVGQSKRGELSFGGRVSEHVEGRVHALSGKPWQLTAVVSPVVTGRASSSVALYAAASELEGQTHAFRRTTNRLRRSRAVNRAELAKGLN